LPVGDYQRELDAALMAVRMATRVCRAVQAGIAPDALEKRDRSPVTVADYASQAAVCHVLAAMFPRDPVVGEENADDLRDAQGEVFRSRVQLELAAIDVHGDDRTILGWIDHGAADVADPATQRFWTLDPIDGTKGFLRKEQYAISLALIEQGAVRLGVLACPNLFAKPGDDTRRGVMFYAVRGGGTASDWIDGSSVDRGRWKLRVSSTRDPVETRFCESVESGHTSHGWSSRVAVQLGTTAEPLRLDSQAKYATVARGEADVYLRLPTRPGYREKIWDHAGGTIVVEEAGGRVTDVDGQPLDFTRGRELSANRGVVVTNGTLNTAVLDAVRATEST
jgi:3'(2'), 5'-bisphosphate nucleotidase